MKNRALVDIFVGLSTPGAINMNQDIEENIVNAWKL